MQTVQAQTIQDFGEQWTRYPENSGYYASQDLFADIVSPLLDPEELVGKTVGDLGSGTGRIVIMLLNTGAGHVVAIEPSAAAEALKRNLQEKNCSEQVTLHQVAGDAFVSDVPLDEAVSIGVLHHIPEPTPAVRAMYASLKPGGRFFVWLYGKEGNEWYLRLTSPLRKLTTLLPHFLLRGVVELCYAGLLGYRLLSRIFPLPMKAYLNRVFWPLSANDRRLVIYDQLKPRYAKYYTREEAKALLSEAGFENIQLHHRHGYSWSVLGEKPSES